MRLDKIMFFLILIGVLMFNEKVNAATYVPTTNLFEGTYSNNLFDMANNQIDNFTSKNYVIFQIDYNYYLVISDDVSFNESSITLNNSTIISAIRNTGSSYNSYYEYYTTSEDITTISLSYMVISNIKTSKTITGNRFEEYKFKRDIKNVGIFILGICFAIFITKERKF